MAKATIDLNHTFKPDNHRKGFNYPSFSSFLKGSITQKVSLKEVREKYEHLGGKPISIAGYCKQVRRAVSLGYCRAVRHEQLFLMPSMNSEYIKPNIIEFKPHSAHRILLSMHYTGTQPEAGATHIKPFGRYGTARQVIFKQGDNTIIAYRKALNVWVHKPPGIRTTDQVLEAKVQGYHALTAFARTHSLTLEGYLNRVLFSHHVIENPQLNAAIKDLIEAYPQIEARIGSKVCETSHKGKVEHEGKGRPDRIIRGDQVAAGLEYLTLDYPKDFGEFAKGAVPALTEQIRLHLEVQRETLATLKAIQEAIKKGKVV